MRTHMRTSSYTRCPRSSAGRIRIATASKYARRRSTKVGYTCTKGAMTASKPGRDTEVRNKRRAATACSITASSLIIVIIINIIIIIIIVIIVVAAIAIVEAKEVERIANNIIKGAGLYKIKIFIFDFLDVGSVIARRNYT